MRSILLYTGFPLEASKGNILLLLVGLTVLVILTMAKCCNETVGYFIINSFFYGEIVGFV